MEELLDHCLRSGKKLIHVDKHVPDLIAVSGASDLAKTPAYLEGLIIFQDKASCFPAYLLNPKPMYGHVLDACAAPGNKTTHLAAISHESDAQNQLIYACERDESRALTLNRMVQTAGASKFVTIRPGQDFLQLDPDKAPWNDVVFLLLDPSCSGSGMTARDESLRIVLPRKPSLKQPQDRSKKRKRKTTIEVTAEVKEIKEEEPISEGQSPGQLSDRLSALSTFQSKLLEHAFHFPKARRITYSTCSIYAEENEHVVVKALNSEVARLRDWRLLPRGQQTSGMRSWAIRGDHKACLEVVASTQKAKEFAEACIRCEKGTKEGTQGFFVAAFVRGESNDTQYHPLDEEWEGFSDSESVT